ncbi:MAG: iron ABC transporter permease [Pseudomonadota bacterium]
MTDLRRALLSASGLLLFSLVLSLCLGVQSYSIGTVFAALTSAEQETVDALVIWSSRVPRTLVALAVGAGLGMAGAMLQTLTRNILADPGLLGINAGAAFGVVLLVAVTATPPSLSTLALASIIGALVTGALVYILAGGAAGIGKDSLRLILAGAVMALALGSLMHILLLLEPGAFEATQLWLAGSIADRPGDMLPFFLPGIGLALVAGLILSPMLSVLMLDATQAASLGANIMRTRVFTLLVASVLCGLSVSLAGPLAFVGLLAPHLARGQVGPRPVALFPLATLFGASLVLLADILARMVIAPAELPIGVILAAMGVPVYILLLTRRRKFA